MKSITFTTTVRVEAVPAGYRREARRVIQAIGALGRRKAAEMRRHLYGRDAAHSLALITNVWWDEAFAAYMEMSRHPQIRSVAPDGSPEEVAGAPR